ncbi:hypothetical protein BU23DRAFT_550554 [Bimuria novae-zelandiae CBS 107.79]|uniref:Uncharacterized protein n=1 Tax=Bimuria novae-zelandiae CBS 107.79 TaxID=1447943 RepID=A0A6A5VLY9_9PLEO|nr:hypothetical protein BU23DRAFT_550554 [Bimuria novae-zelandiae CBS 107.79]
MFILAVTAYDIASDHADVFRSGFADLGSNLVSNFSNSTILLNSAGVLPSLLFARQQFVCPDPGGPSCSATTCCATGQKCVSI